MRIGKLCSQINEQLKQNQIMVPAEITPLLSNTFTGLAWETQTSLSSQWRESKPLCVHPPSPPLSAHTHTQRDVFSVHPSIYSEHSGKE